MADLIDFIETESSCYIEPGYDRLMIRGISDELCSTLTALIEPHNGKEALEYWRQNHVPLAVDFPPATEAEPTDRYVPFPVDVLPPIVARYITEASAAIGCDASFVALPLLTALGSCIGNAYRLVVKKDWYALPVLWTVVIGKSGTAKTPAFSQATKHANRIQSRHLREYGKAAKEYKTKALEYKKQLREWKANRTEQPEETPPDEPEAPVPIRTLVQDSTVEALAPMLLASPKGVLMIQHELQAWFGSFDKYRGGKAESDRAHWLALFDGVSITVDRKSQGAVPIYVPTGTVAVTGTIQPSILAGALTKDHRDSGLSARLLMAYPPASVPDWSDREVSESTDAALKELFDQLSSLKMRWDGEQWESNYLGMAGSAKDRFIRWHNAHQAEVRLIADDEERAAWTKFLGYGPRFALLIQMITDPKSERVELPAVQSAICIVEWFKSELERIYATLDGDERSEHWKQLAAWIRSKGGSVTVRDLTRGPRQYRKKPEAAEATLKELARAGFGYFDIGRKSNVFHLLPSGDGDRCATNTES